MTDAQQVEISSEESGAVETQEAQEVQEVHGSAEEAQEVIADTQEPTQETQEQSADEELPEWFMKDKYKSVDEQARSAYELQKKMGKYWGSPTDDYSIEGMEGIAKDDPIVAGLAPTLKEIGLSQDGFKELVSKYQEANIAMAQKFESELKKELTENDAATYNAVDKWMTDNLSNEEKQQVQNNWLMTPADFKLFNELRLMAPSKSSVPSSSDNSSAMFESSTSVENDKIKYRKEVKSGLRVKDKNFESELAQRYRDARTREMRSK